MTDYTELERDLDTYMNPQTLEDRILKNLSKELYAKDPIKYNSFMEAFYTETVSQAKKDIHILYHWLECSDFTAPVALKTLALHPTPHELLKTSYSHEIKTKVLTMWFLAKEPAQILKLFSIFAANVTSEHLDDLSQLKLVIDVLLPNKQSFIESPLRLGLNSILSAIDLSNLPDIETVRLMSLHPYLKEEILAQISKLYDTDIEFNKLLSTAQALGVVENPDYWVQSLPITKQLDLTQSDATLPSFE